MKSWFLVRGYPNNLVKEKMSKVCFSKGTGSKSKSQESKGVPLAIAFHPKFKLIGKLLNKHLHILYMDQETKNVFTPGPMATFHSARKLSSYLVRAKLYPIERIVGSHKGKCKRCEVCLNVQQTSCFSSSVTNETYKINHQLECNEKCLIYLLTCKNCLKQYFGQTIDTFRHRWNNYKTNHRKFQRYEPCMQEHLFHHFSSPGHNGFLNDVSVTFLDKMEPEILLNVKYFLQLLLLPLRLILLLFSFY